jgi:pilus assembly protein CpaE
MERPTLFLALAVPDASYTDTLTSAGFDVVADRQEALRRMSAGQPPDLAVLDCDLPADALDEAYRALHGENSVPTILLFGAEIPEFEATPSSVRDEYAVKPIPPDALAFRLQALLIRSGRALVAETGGWTETSTDDGTNIGEGHVISIFAPKGGVGKTTVAVNLAVAIREQTRASVLLLDADVGVGNVTSVLAAPYRMGLADLADSSPEEWTDAAFDHAATTHKESGVRVLTWGSEPGDSERVGVDLLLAALRWAKAHHSFVVIDNHPGYDDRTMAMLTVAREIFLVVTPEVGPLRNSAQFLDLAREVGLGGSVKVIINRANHGISIPDIEQALKLPVSATIVSNGPKAVIAANEGSPMVTRFPKERMATDLHNVARLVTQPATRETASTADRRKWWSSLVPRASA